MILLITSSAKGPQCVDCLHAATGLETQWAQSLQEAATRLREQTYSAVVIDQFLLETDPGESDQMIEHLGTAFPVYLNFAVTGMERLVREVRSALHRRKREEGAARCRRSNAQRNARDSHRHAPFLRACHVCA
jgi:DNA-binding NtrC family response regulator